MSEFQELMKEAEMARAYISITNEMGPSEQLLAFVNFDQTLSNEIGLESFDRLSLNTRHEIFAASLNPELLEGIALEGFLSKLGNLIGIYKTAKEDSIHTLEEAVSGDLKEKTDVAEVIVPSYAEFAGWLGIGKFNIKLIEEYLKHIPTTENTSEWEKFDLLVDKEILPRLEKEHEHINALIVKEHKNGDRFKTSGWNAAKLKDAIHEVNGFSEEFHKSKVEFAEKLVMVKGLVEKLEKDKEGRESLKKIEKAIGYSPKLINFDDSDLKELESIVKKVLSCFEVSK